MAAGSFWKAAGVTAGMNYTRFRSQVSPCQYEDLAPAIAKMKAGQRDVLWPGQCGIYVAGSGTTTGAGPNQPKHLPITPEMLTHFRQAGAESLYYYTARRGNAGVFKGRHLFLGGSTALTPLPASKLGGSYSGDLSALTTLNLSPAAKEHVYEPGPQIAEIADWKEKLDAIVASTRHLDISLLAGIPNWVLLLAEAFRQEFGEEAGANLQQIWPNLECLVHAGAPIGPFGEELRAALGPGVNFHEVYPAAEGIIAAQDAHAREGLRLMTGAGIFYEFLPMEDFNEARLSQLGEKVVPLEHVRAGIDYALLVTTPAGLCRYAMGDIVRFTSTEPPRLQYVGRTRLQLSAFEERVSEKDLTDALVTVCQRNGWPIVNFHVAPLFTNPLYGTTRGRHEWWVELRPGTVITPTGPQMAVELDMELQRSSASYEGKRKGYGLESPVVRLVMPGLFEHWMRHESRWGGQYKMPRCRSDREIADQLADIAQFAKD